MKFTWKILNSEADEYHVDSLADDYDWTVDWRLPKKLHDIGLTGGEKEWHLSYDSWYLYYETEDKGRQYEYYYHDKFRIAGFFKGRERYYDLHPQRSNDTIYWSIEAKFVPGLWFAYFTN